MIDTVRDIGPHSAVGSVIFLGVVVVVVVAVVFVVVAIVVSIVIIDDDNNIEGVIIAAASAVDSKSSHCATQLVAKNGNFLYPTAFAVRYYRSLPKSSRSLWVGVCVTCL